MDLIVIGGGAAGMMCSITAAKNGAAVMLIDKNEKTGKKLYITGKGRCNLTNCTDFNSYMDNIISNKKFLYSSLKEFDCNKTIDFFQNNGLNLKTERGNRVFPASDKSSDVIKALNKQLSLLKVDVRLNETVLQVNINNSGTFRIVTNNGEYFSQRVAICTGGLSYPSTGSTGDGYKFAKHLGHSLIPVKPALCGINISSAYNAFLDKYVSLRTLPILQGLSLKNVAVSAYCQDKLIAKEFGEMLFTDQGVSGPIILTLSSKINRIDPEKVILKIDLKPALTEDNLDKRLLRDFSQNINKILKNSLSELLPSGLIPFIISLSGISENKQINSIAKEERKRLISVIKNLTLQVNSLENISSAIITAGGINVKEINPKTMESKLIKNLFFAGEVIDVDALTGGFNLQIAFATGYAAGKYSTLNT